MSSLQLFTKESVQLVPTVLPAPNVPPQEHQLVHVFLNVPLTHLGLLALLAIQLATLVGVLIHRTVSPV